MCLMRSRVVVAPTGSLPTFTLPLFFSSVPENFFSSTTQGDRGMDDVVFGTEVV